MKSFIPIEEQGNEKPNIIDFLDSLDTDANTTTIKLDDSAEIKSKVDEIENSKEKSAEDQECTALTVTKPNSLFAAQKMFKKSIKISIKSFLISLSLGFLNLFI